MAKGIWCVGEIRNGKLTPALSELITAGKKLAAARGESVTAVVVGAPGAGELAKAAGAEKVIALEHASFAHFIDEAHARALVEQAKKDAPAIVLLPGSVWGRSVAPRLAVGMSGAAVSDALDIAADGGNLTVTRSSYAGGAIATVSVKALPVVITVRPMAFGRAAAASAAVSVVAVDPSSWGLKTEFVSFAPEQSSEIDLSTAEKIVSGGRGLGDAKGFELVRSLAQSLGAAVGASRAVVDAGWIAYKHQVG
ncbi:MAG TPA: electron transfer flavoprotein subunit alpha/FixB family protein, partial [Elusimicrobiota bacterium]|nr:electron transfer flavoprotein subunit alpha/FixB family protein [Elusimicrobiota bacterium]